MKNVFYRPDSLRSLMVKGDEGYDDQDDQKREGMLRNGKEENRKKSEKRKKLSHYLSVFQIAGNESY